MQRVQHTHTEGQIRCRSYNSGQHWAGGGQRAGWFLRVTRAWGVTSQRLVWCGDGPARPPQPGPSRYVLHQLRSPQKNGAKRPAHLTNVLSHIRGAHITRPSTHARAAARALHTPRGPPACHRMRQLGPNHGTTSPRQGPEGPGLARLPPPTERTLRLFRHHIPTRNHLAHGWGSRLPFTHGWDDRAHPQD